MPSPFGHFQGHTLGPRPTKANTNVRSSSRSPLVFMIQGSGIGEHLTRIFDTTWSVQNNILKKIPDSHSNS
ncbi:hypothetical protein BST61_g8672 [Cercospora zeina]